MFTDFQEAVVLVVGDAVWVIAIFVFAGALLLSILHVLLLGIRRYTS